MTREEIDKVKLTLDGVKKATDISAEIKMFAVMGVAILDKLQDIDESLRDILREL